LERIEELLFHAKDTMTSPCSFHFLSHVSDPKAFEVSKKRFSQNLKRALQRQYKGTKQATPEILWVYSIEFKMTELEEIFAVDELNDNEEIPSFELKTTLLPFLHIHLHVIADCKKTRPQDFPKHVMQALNEVKGLTKARYFATKAHKVSVYNDETLKRTTEKVEAKVYKKVKTEFDDVYDRMKYLAKVEQKNRDFIPFRQTFDTSRLTKRKVTVAKTAKVATA
jgi:hypothetical protein